MRIHKCFAKHGQRRVFLGSKKAAKDLSGASYPCKSIPCLQGSNRSVPNAMNDKLKIKIKLVLADLIFTYLFIYFLVRRSLWQN